MKYRLLSFEHHPFLKHILYDIYVLEAGEEQEAYFAAPNGTIGLSVVTSGESWYKQSGTWTKAPHSCIFGLITKPFEFRITPNYREISIGFKPYFLQLLLRENMMHLTDGAITDTSELFDKSDLSCLNEELQKALSDEKILVAVNAFLIKYYNPDKLDDRLLHAMNMIYANKVLKVKELAAYLQFSTTTLRNLFREHIGLSPKQLIRTVRTHQALNFRNIGQTNFTEMAHDLLYFDQAHFIHDFKQSMGMTPGQYFKNEALTFDFYNFGRWRSDTFGRN